MAKKALAKKPSSLAEQKEFRPSPAQLLWVDTAVKLCTDSVTKISRECKVSRTAWYLWLKDQAFIDWFVDTWNKKIRVFGPKLDLIGIKKAGEDVKYWQGMQKRVGNFTDQPQQQQAQAVNINIIQDQEDYQ